MKNRSFLEFKTEMIIFCQAMEIIDTLRTICVLNLYELFSERSATSTKFQNSWFSK